MAKEKTKCPSQVRDGWTAMHLAAHYGRDKIMAHLLAQRPHWVDEVTSKQRNPLHIAAKRGHSNIVAQLLDATTNNEDLLKPDWNKNNALHLAVKHNQSAVIARLLHRDHALADSTTFSGLTVLHLAAHQGHTGLFDLLVKVYPHLLDVVDSFGRTPLHYAAEAGHVGLLHYLDHLMPIACKASWTPLHLAAEAGQIGVVEHFLDRMPRLVEARSYCGKTALHLAARNGLRAVAERLVLDRPESMDAVDEEGRTALHFAVRDGQEEMTRDLLNWRPSLIDVADSKGKTVLYEALKNKHGSIVELILNHKPAVVDANMLQLALKEDRLVQALLVSKPELVYDVDSEGNTVLHRAVAIPQQPLYSNAVGLVAMVLKMFPDAVRAVNKQNQTPLHVALSASNHLAVRVLRWQLSLDEITEAFTACAKENPLEQLRPLVERQCEDWNQDLLKVVFDYLGFVDHKPPKRKREEEDEEEE